jgi:beta-lactamase regulating signal transducer with metallopeptidase domain
VLVKLVTPPLVDVPVPWPAAPLPPATDTPLVREDLPSVEPVATGNALVREEAPALVVETAVPDNVAPEGPEVVPPGPSPWDWERMLCGAWLAGSLGWFLVASMRVACFRRLLRHGRAAPEELRERVEALARRVGLRRCPQVLLMPGRVAPLVWAFAGRPRLCLPAGLLGQVDDAALETLMLHELAHLRRRDHWVRRLEFVVLGLYWWHPVAWYARRELREAEEQCCDAWVVAALPGSGRTYAAALVDTLDFLSAEAAAVPLTASAIGQFADLKRRLTMILRGTTPRGLGRGGLLAVLGLGALLPLWPHLARAETVREEEDPPPARAESPELDKARAELRRVEAELQKKLAEVQALEAKLKAEAALRERVRYIRVPTVLERVRVAEEVRPGGGRVGWQVVAPEAKGPVIQIEISGTEKADEVQDILKKIQKELGDKARILILVRAQDALKPAPPPVAVPAPGTVVPPGARFAPPMMPPAQDKLERKLEELQRELEALRREIRAPKPGGSAVPPLPGTPVPPAPAPVDPFGR